jgi:hypothetical protein
VKAEAVVAQAMETVSTHARNPKVQERQQLAGLFNVPVRAVRSHMTSWYKERLESTVADGKTVEEAIKVVRKLVPSGGQPAPASSVPQEEPPPPPPSPAAVCLGAAFADVLGQHLGSGFGSSPTLLTQEQVAAMLTATLLAPPAVFDGSAWEDTVAAIPLALQRLYAHITALIEWWNVLNDLGVADPSTFCIILDQLRAQRYQHPPAMARTVGHAIASLEAYLEEHAPTSTNHPARHAMEL